MIDCISAPIAESENDSISDTENVNVEVKEEVKLRRSYSDPWDISLETTLNNSLEDLISTFDEKIFKCFQDFKTDTSEIAPIYETSEILKEPIWWQNSYSEEIKLTKDQISAKANIIAWNDFTDLPDKKNPTVMAVDSSSLKSAECLLMEIQEMMDYNDNNVDFERIEESFYDSDLSDSVKDAVVNFQSDWLNKEGSEKWKNALSSLSSESLKMIINDMKARVCTLSDCLLIHLATRDELEFEREVRDRFMLLLQGVQKRQRELARTVFNQRHNAAELRQKNRNANRWSWNGSWGNLFRNQKLRIADIPMNQLHDMKSNGTKINNDSDNNNNNNNNEEENIVIVTNKNTKNNSNEAFKDNNYLDSLKLNGSKKNINKKSLENTLKYLSTTIPFKSGISSANIQHLQIFNKILLAILQENSKLDSILTDYLLNVYTSSSDRRNWYCAPDNCNNYQVEAT